MKNTNEPRTPTEAQVNANRENAKKSTGPRTAEGKAASSRNRLLHGLRANKHILVDEDDPEDFLILLKDLYDRFQPAGDGEERLVLRIANDQWRLDRTLPMEAATYRQRLEAVAATDHIRKQELRNHKRNYELRPESVPPPPPAPDLGDRLTHAFHIDCEGPNSFAKLARYESSIARCIDRSLRQLEKYQAARRTSTPPADEPLDLPPESPETGQAVPPAEAAQPAEPPAANPSHTANYHSNPKNGGIAKSRVPSGSAAMLLLMHALLHTVPQLIALLGSLLTGPRRSHKYGDVKRFHRPATAQPGQWACAFARHRHCLPPPTVRQKRRPQFAPAYIS